MEKLVLVLLFLPQAYTPIRTSGTLGSSGGKPRCAGLKDTGPNAGRVGKRGFSSCRHQGWTNLQHPRLSLSSSAADLSTLTLSWLEPLMEKSDEIVLNKDPTFSTGCSVTAEESRKQNTSKLEPPQANRSKTQMSQ
ncbi:hypothetical protein Anapl_11599 [Anas platyrhynchos]|uniref:Uncharacterized protein n=1 Tax=Anas platyrhynchos TaxID=8839 RepID=R0LA54_ANAPL|nr:hypothetical protein Anapl_11599 [Anas platyrhynchos]